MYKALGEFFEQRGAGTRPGLRSNQAGPIDCRVQSVADQRDKRANRHAAQHSPEREQFVGIDQLQSEQENQNRKQAQAGLGKQRLKWTAKASKNAKRNHVLSRDVAVPIGRRGIAAGQRGVQVRKQHDPEIQLRAQVGIVVAASMRSKGW